MVYIQQSEGNILLRGLNSNELENEEEYDEYITSELFKLPKDELVKLARLAFFADTKSKRNGFRFMFPKKHGQQIETPKKFSLHDYWKSKRFRTHF
jgi:hypothetical protein